MVTFMSIDNLTKERYNVEDISVIIPTYNRENDLKEKLSQNKHIIQSIKELLIIDQSTNKDIFTLIKKLKNNKIKYFHLQKPSLTAARNFGVSKVSKSSKIICFLDDDVTLSKNYLKEIISVFNNSVSVLAVGGYQAHKPSSFPNRLLNIFKKLFFLGHLEKNNAYVSSTYGNNYPSELTRTINSNWIPGLNMCFKKIIFKEQKFDENLKGYALAEDLDFSYRIFKKHSNSLFISPYASVIHRTSDVERYPTEKLIYTNQINHFYLNFKNFNSNFKEKFIFVWTLTGIVFLRLFGILLAPNKMNYLKLKFFILSLFFCFRNLSSIKKGHLDFKLN